MAVVVLEPGTWGVDYSFAHPDPAAIVAWATEGGSPLPTFASRYIGPGSGKLLTAAERDALFSAGVCVMLNAELDNTAWRNGYNEGQRQAALAEQACRDLGAPIDLPVFFSIDTDVGTNDYDTVDAFFQGAGSATQQPIGVYSESPLIDWLHSNGLAEWYWETNAWAWSSDYHTPLAHVRQYGHVLGGTCDKNVTRRPLPVWSSQSDAPSVPSARKVLMPSHVCFASAPDGTFVEVVECHDGRHRWREVGDIPGGAGSFYACHPNGDGVNPIGQNELDTQTQYDAVADAAWLGQHLGITGGGSGASAAQVVDELSRRLANG